MSIRELRNHGGEVVDRAAAGEAIAITRAGKRVAELRPAPSAPLSAEVLIERRRRLPRVDARALRAEIDATLDAQL